MTAISKYAHLSPEARVVAYERYRARTPISLPNWSSDLDMWCAVRALLDDLSTAAGIAARNSPHPQYVQAMECLQDALWDAHGAATLACEAADDIEMYAEREG